MHAFYVDVFGKVSQPSGQHKVALPHPQGIPHVAVKAGLTTSQETTFPQRDKSVDRSGRSPCLLKPVRPSENGCTQGAPTLMEISLNPGTSKTTRMVGALFPFISLSDRNEPFRPKQAGSKLHKLPRAREGLQALPRWLAQWHPAACRSEPDLRPDGTCLQGLKIRLRKEHGPFLKGNQFKKQWLDQTLSPVPTCCFDVTRPSSHQHVRCKGKVQSRPKG